MSKTSIKNSGNNIAFRITHSYLNPTTQLDKANNSTTLANLVLGADSKDPAKEMIKRSSDHLKDSQYHGSHHNSPTKDLSNLRKIVETKIYADSKSLGDMSPTKRNIAFRVSGPKLFSTLDTLPGSQLLDQDKNGQNWVKDKFAEPNELKTMDQVMTQLKKVSRENHINLESERMRENKLNPKMPVHLQKREFLRTESALNNVILKKLGLDPKTKERQFTHFVSALDRDFSKNAVLRKQMKARLGSLGRMNFEKIIPTSLLGPSESSNMSLLQGQGGSRILAELNESELKCMERLALDEDEERRICAMDPDNLTLIQSHAKIAEKEIGRIGKTLSFPEMDTKNEFLPDFLGTPMSNILIAEEASPKVTKEFDSGVKKVCPLEEEEGEFVYDKEAVAMQGLRSRIDEILRKDRSRETLLMQENQRLNQEILSLKAKLKVYEERCPELILTTENN